jgi:hypothetical protein
LNGGPSVQSLDDIKREDPEFYWRRNASDNRYYYSRRKIINLVKEEIKKGHSVEAAIALVEDMKHKSNKSSLTTFAKWLGKQNTARKS